jgi:hypothetical protein
MEIIFPSSFFVFRSNLYSESDSGIFGLGVGKTRMCVLLLVTVILERWLSGRKRQIANLLRVLTSFEGSNPSLSVLKLL